MKDEDLARFSTAFLVMADSCYDKKQVPAETVIIYFEGLKEFSLDAVLRAMREHTSTPVRCKFWPKPGCIKELISGSRATEALRAWTKVEKTIRSYGRYRSVVFDDGAIHAVIDEMGGWVKLCDVQSEKDLEFVRHGFCKRYEVTSSDLEFPAVLLGVLDSESVREGRQKRAPMLIGDPFRAQEVMKLGASFAQIPAARMALPIEEMRVLEGGT